MSYFAKIWHSIPRKLIANLTLHIRLVRRNSRYQSELSKKNQMVISYLETHPTATIVELANALAISAAAAKKRIQRLLTSGVLTPRLGINPGFSRFGARSVVSMKIAMNKLKRRKEPGYGDLRQFVSFISSGLIKTREWASFFRSKDGEALTVDDAYSISGGGMGIDVILVISGTSEALIREFVTDVLGALSGVDETNTAVIGYDGGFELELSRSARVR